MEGFLPPSGEDREPKVQPGERDQLTELLAPEEAAQAAAATAAVSAAAAPAGLNHLFPQRGDGD